MMLIQHEFIESMRRVTQSFHNVIYEVKLATERLVEFVKSYAEDAFVEQKGIARSDIRCVKFEDGVWVAHLYNHRKVYLCDV